MMARDEEKAAALPRATENKNPQTRLLPENFSQTRGEITPELRPSASNRRSRAGIVDGQNGG
jgi:hypothetical protein